MRPDSPVFQPGTPPQPRAVSCRAYRLLAGRDSVRPRGRSVRPRDCKGASIRPVFWRRRGSVAAADGAPRVRSCTTHDTYCPGPEDRDGRPTVTFASAAFGTPWRAHV